MTTFPGDSGAFGEYLRALRLRAGLSQEQLAERSGLTQAAVGALERGQRRHPYPHTMQSLAMALGLGPAERERLFQSVPGRRQPGKPAGRVADDDGRPARLPSVTSWVGPENAGNLAEPEIRYAKTADGVRIGFLTAGDGPALVVLPSLPMSHLLAEWQFQPFRDFILRLAAGRTLVRYDPRGLGVSDAQATDVSLEAHVLDVVAVLDRLGIERCSVFAPSYSGPIGLALAALHPERVERLILWCSHASFADVAERVAPDHARQRQAVVDLAKVDPSLAIHTYTHHAVAWASNEAVGFDILALKSGDPCDFFERLETYAAFDAGPLIPGVQVETLIMHRTGFHASHVDVARDLAASLPQGRLMLLEGASVIPFVGDTNSVLRGVHAFLGERPGVRGLLEDGIPTAVQALLFTDVEGHSALIDKLGDEPGRAVLREHDRLIREAIRAHDGLEVKALGDGFLARFRSVQRALECAIALQRSLAAASADGASELGRATELGIGVRVRVGVNAGEPVSEDDDIFGTVVNAVSRIAAAARGGEILAADVVRQLAQGKRFVFRDRGTVHLRGLADPVRVHEVEWRVAGG